MNIKDAVEYMIGWQKCRNTDFEECISHDDCQECPCKFDGTDDLDDDAFSTVIEYFEKNGYVSSADLIDAFNKTIAELEDKKKKISRYNVSESNGYTIAISVVRKYLKGALDKNEMS